MAWIAALDNWLSGLVPGLAMVHVSAMIGVLFHEGVRIYRSVWDNAPISVLRRPILYSVALLILSVIGISLAFLVDVKTAYQALFVGFAVPTSIRTVIGDMGHIHSDDHFGMDAAEADRNSEGMAQREKAKEGALPSAREFVGSLVRP
jgi:hypothetical protein